MTTPEKVDAGDWRAEILRRAELVVSGNCAAFTVEEVNAEVRRAVEEARSRRNATSRERSNGGDSP